MLHDATTEVARSEDWAIGYHSEIVLENPTHQLYAYAFAPQELPMPRVPMPYRGAHTFCSMTLQGFLFISPP